MIELKDEIRELLENQSYLRLKECEDKYILEGKYQYSLNYNGYISQGNKKIKLVIPKSFPNEIPILYVFDYPKHIEHIYPDNSVCLATIGELINFLNKNSSLIAFVDKFIDSFIFTIDWFKKYKTYPFGDRKHGYKGLLDYYLNDLNLTKNNYIEMVFLVKNNNYRGHNDCFCGSNKKIRNCHGKYILPIIKNRFYKQKFLEEALMIMTEDGKNVSK
ncbi:hypothetical protein [Streptobacillus moniliformis]|uniref:hypothetical protein n=1 Tax=Streptobacillus moniliformis TaxID=34105 RepID=UPI0007E3BA88|nr:hypothetical protein [Streptobacillus moniliformis]